MRVCSLSLVSRSATDDAAVATSVGPRGCLDAGAVVAARVPTAGTAATATWSGMEGRMWRGRRPGMARAGTPRRAHGAAQERSGRAGACRRPRSAAWHQPARSRRARTGRACRQGLRPGHQMSDVDGRVELGGGRGIRVGSVDHGGNRGGMASAGSTTSVSDRALGVTEGRCGSPVVFRDAGAVGVCRPRDRRRSPGAAATRSGTAPGTSRRPAPQTARPVVLIDRAHREVIKSRASPRRGPATPRSRGWQPRVAKGLGGVALADLPVPAPRRGWATGGLS